MKLAYKNIFFLGIGGIGMSALARYFHHLKHKVSGYDKTLSSLTQQLEKEGISVHYDDLGEGVENIIGSSTDTLIVWTPAVPKDLAEYIYLERKGYTILKRAAVLGAISSHYKTLAVAGTHGKTTTSTMLAYVLSKSTFGCNAFLGGIGVNFNSNLLLNPNSEWMVVEADEFDRSFHQLHPFSSIITSVEADHLDIYNNAKSLEDAFTIFGNLTATDGKLVVHNPIDNFKNRTTITYGLSENEQIDYRGFNLRIENENFVIDIQTPKSIEKNVVLGIPGIHNADNAIAVIALCDQIGIPFSIIRNAIETFRGVKRRFETIVNKDGIVYIDDYAHHPTAIESLLKSVRLIYKDKPIHIIFQPHLYSRTRDFMDGFAQALSHADEVILMPIYPARELPIEGITSEALAKKIPLPTKILRHEAVLEEVKSFKNGVLLTVGAGNIDRLIQPIQDILNEKNN